MFHISGMALILVSKFFIFLTNLLPLCLCYWKLCSKKKKTPPNYYNLSLQKKSHTYRNKSHNVFSSHANECFLFFCPIFSALREACIKFSTRETSCKVCGGWTAEGRAPSSLSPTQCYLAKHPQTKLDPKPSCDEPCWIFQICMNCANC